MAADPRRPLPVVHADRAAARGPEPRLARRRAGARRRVRDVAAACAGARRRPVLRTRARARRRRAVLLDAARRVLAALPGLGRLRLAVAGRADGPRARPARAQHGPLDLRRRRRRRARAACSGRRSCGSGSAGASSSSGFAVVALALVAPGSGARPSRPSDGERPRLRDALRAIRRREVFRWLFLLELSDLLGDVLLGFLALYFVDAVGSSRGDRRAGRRGLERSRARRSRRDDSAAATSRRSALPARERGRDCSPLRRVPRWRPAVEAKLALVAAHRGRQRRLVPGAAGAALRRARRTAAASC